MACVAGLPFGASVVDREAVGCPVAVNHRADPVLAVVDRTSSGRSVMSRS